MKKIAKTLVAISSTFAAISSSLLLMSCRAKDMFEQVLTDDMQPYEVQVALNGVISNNKYISYNSASYYFDKCDADPDKKGNIILYYTGESYTPNIKSYGTGINQINNEHVWCQSRFRTYSDNRSSNDYDNLTVPTPYSDLYNIRPCRGKVNTDRSNYFYAENTEADSLDPFDPKNYPGCKEEYRGDIARILFYDATRYLELKIIEDLDASTYDSFEMGRLSDLLAWNLKYAPSKYEKLRNDALEEIQGNRNPFVDHSEYACRIWGLTNDKTKQICGM